MKHRAELRRVRRWVPWIVLVAAAAIGAWAQGSAADQKMAAIKQSLQSSMAALRAYEWVETVTVSVKGEQESQKKNSC